MPYRNWGRASEVTFVIRFKQSHSRIGEHSTGKALPIFFAFPIILPSIITEMNKILALYSDFILLVVKS